MPQEPKMLGRREEDFLHVGLHTVGLIFELSSEYYKDCYLSILS